MKARPTLQTLAFAIVALGSAACAADAEETASRPVMPPAEEPPRDVPDLPEEQDEETPAEEPMLPPADGMCGALVELVSSEAPVSECEEALAADCERIVGTLNDPYVDSVEVCIDQGGDVIACMMDSVDAFEKTPAHDALASAYCDACAFGVPGCEELFYVNDSDYGLGTVLLPFSDEVLDAVRAECTSGFTCAVDFPTCAMDVVRERLNVDDSRECLLDEVL
jgi:hypothetical protein